MTIGQKIGIALLVLAFIGAKILVLFSKPTGIGVAVLGAALTIFSEPAEAM